MRWAAERSGPDPRRWACVGYVTPGGAEFGLSFFHFFSFLFFFFFFKHVTVSGIIVVVLKGGNYKREGLLLLENYIIITAQIKGDR